jgi:hypothetical protein
MDVDVLLRHVLRQVGDRKYVPHWAAPEVDHQRVLHCEGSLFNELWDQQHFIGFGNNSFLFSEITFDQVFVVGRKVF